MKIGILFMLLLPLSLWAQVELNLDLCRSMALQNSKEVIIAGKEREKAAYDVKAYQTNYLPKLSVSGLGFYNQKKYNYKLKGGYLPTYKPGENGQLEPNVVIDPVTQKPVIGPDGNPVFQEYAFMPDIHLRLSLRGVYAAGVQLEQPVYMGGKVRAAHEMAKVGEMIAGENVRNTQADVLVSADEAYWQLLRVREQAVAARSYKEAVSELLKDLQDARQVGMTTGNDVLKAQVRYNDAELMLQKAQNGEILAQMNLCRVIGLDLGTELYLRDSLTETVAPEIWVLDTALTQRPDYNMLENEVNLKKRQIALVKSDFLPQIGVTAGYGYAGGIKLNGDDEASATFSALAAVKIPVFHWGEGRSKVRAAQMEQEISQLNLAHAADLMQLEIASARFNIRDAITRVTMARNALQQARENLTISENQYDVGLENLTDLLEAQAQWQQAWSQWIDAKTMLHLSETQYLKAIGRLVSR